MPFSSGARAGVTSIRGSPSASTSRSTRSTGVAFVDGNATQKFLPTTRSAGRPVIRAAGALHSAIVQSGLIAITPTSRLSSTILGSIGCLVGFPNTLHGPPPIP